MSKRDAWVDASFSEINDFSPQTVDPAKSPDERFELYSVPAFPSGEPEFQLGSAIGSTKQLVLPGDVLVCKINPRINRVWAVTQQSGHRQIASSEWIVMRPSGWNARYLRHYFSSPDFRDRIRDGVTGVGGSLARAQPKRVATLDVPLAPLNEQKRIADKLDAVFARLDACRERLDRMTAIVKHFRQSVLAASASGKLTEEWAASQRADDWSSVSVHAIATDVFDGPFGSHLMSKDYSSAGVRVVRLENIGRLRFVAEKETFIPRRKYETLRKHTLEAEDVLFSSFISEEVRVCLLPTALSKKAINKADCFCIRVDPSVCSPTFLAIRLASRSTFLALERQIHGATRPRINLRQLKELTFDLPSLREQAEIVRRVDFLFAYADRLEAHYTAARAQVERLTPVLLAKAFRGELAPQDPSDEPAPVLLARIRASRCS